MTQYDITPYIDKLYAAAFHKARDSFAAEELVQETCLAALQALARGKEPANLQAWLFAILSNKHCDRLRKLYNEPQISFDSFPQELPAETPEEDDTAEKLEHIRRELGYLAKTHREVMVRYYMRGESVNTIAKALGIPAGTVKSRLHTGRNDIRKGAVSMETYTTQSFSPDFLHISCAGSCGIHNEPFSLVPHEDTLAQSVLLTAYERPLTVIEIAKALGVPAAFIEPLVEKLVQGELMARTDGGKVYTDFIIYTDKDRTATFRQQLAIAQEHFLLFWESLSSTLAELRAKPYYQRQAETAKAMLTLHLCVKALLNATIRVMDDFAGAMPYADYPYRADGGRWITMGQRYPNGYQPSDDAEFWKYGMGGEAGDLVRNFHDTSTLELRAYNTSLGTYPYQHLDGEHLKWLYEVYAGVLESNSGVAPHIAEAVGDFVEAGVVDRGDTLTLALPVLSPAEYADECALADTATQAIYAASRGVLGELFQTGIVHLPAHLTSVPNWQRYMLCSDSIPMAVVHKAIEDGLLFEGITHKLPACILVVGK